MRMIYWVIGFLFLTTSMAFAAPKTASDYFSLGTRLYNAKDFEGAYYAFEAGLVLNPKSAAGYQGLGDSLYFSGHQYDAMKAYQKSLALNPNNPKLTAFVKDFKPNDIPTVTVTPSATGEDRVVVSGQDLGATGNKTASQGPTAVSTPDLRLALDKNTWVRGYVGYDFALLSDLTTSLNVLGSSLAASSGVTGTTSSGSNGILAGVEFGVAVDPGNAFSICIENVWTQTESFNSGVSNVSDPNATFQPSFSPSLTSVALNYYAFIPNDKGSRTYFQFGAGLYQAVVGFTGWDPATILSSPQESGSFSAVGLGGTFGIGETMVLDKSFALDIVGRGRIVSFGQMTADQITRGGAATTDGPYAIAVNSTTGAIAVVPVGNNIGGAYRYAVVDYSGFDVNFALTYFF